MAKYMLIESRDPFTSNEVAQNYALAAGLVGAGNEVTVFLVQNGVLPARAGTRADGLSALTTAGVTVLADSFSLRERAIAGDMLADGVSAAELDVVVDALADGAKTIWN
ncbi:MAG: DsrE family protein [Alphaproteobacteria bacterium]